LGWRTRFGAWQIPGVLVDIRVPIPFFSDIGVEVKNKNIVEFEQRISV
jgi:hypothetical protein